MYYALNDKSCEEVMIDVHRPDGTGTMTGNTGGNLPAHNATSGFQPILESLRSIRELDLAGHDVLMRVDANVPRDGQKILDQTRLRGFRDTVHFALDQGATSVMLLSHFGKGDPAKDSLKCVAELLPQILARGENSPVVWFREQYVEGSDQEKLRCEIDDFKAANPKTGLVVLLENTRFHKGEKGNDTEFAVKLACLADRYVNDAFGAAHRADDASVGKLAELYMHDKTCAIGLLMERELERVERMMLRAKEPLVVVLGGSKIDTKLPILKALIDGPTKEITLFLAGETGLALDAARAAKKAAADGVAPPYTNLKPETIALGMELDEAILKKGCQVFLPIDARIAPAGVKPKEVTSTSVKRVTEIPEGHVLFDIGPETEELFVAKLKEKLANGGTLIANGTMGVYENPLFKSGSLRLNKAIASLSTSVDRLIGGGDTGGIAIECGVPESMVSTGGGALLDAIEKGTAAMPALAPLRR